MRYLVFVLFFGSFYSCNYYEKKKLNSNTILMDELKTFNWNEVDRYPNFENCTDSINFQDNKNCFEHTITTHISKYFSTQNIIVTQTVSDTILIDLLVSKNGEIKIFQTQTHELTKQQIPELDSILKSSLEGLPKLYPAIKRSQQVQTVFQLPIILRVD
jgi:hypothetical protein